MFSAEGHGEAFRFPHPNMSQRQTYMPDEVRDVVRSGRTDGKIGRNLGV